MFLVAGDGTIFDFDLEFLREVVRLLDTQLEQLEEKATRLLDPDSFGVYDSAEYIVGLGFTACQGYLAATYGGLQLKKEKALKAGPGHRSGYTIAELVNHAANFWKHHEEWPLNPSDRRQAHTLAALTALDIAESHYPLTCVLAAVVLPTRVVFTRCCRIWRLGVMLSSCCLNRRLQRTGLRLPLSANRSASLG